MKYLSVPQTTSPTRDDDDDELSGGAIAGIVIAIVVAVVLLVVLLVLLIVCLILRKKNRSGEFKPSFETQGIFLSPNLYLFLQMYYISNSLHDVANIISKVLQ